MDFETGGAHLLPLSLRILLLLLLQNTQDCQELSLEAQGLLSVPRPYWSGVTGPSLYLYVPIVYHGYNLKPRSWEVFAFVSFLSF